MSERDEFVEEQDLPGAGGEEAEEMPASEEAELKPEAEERLPVVDLNTATLEELRQLPGIGEALAARIVNYRVEVQPFREPADIMAVSGVSSATYENIADRLTVSPIESIEAGGEVEEEPVPEAEPEVESEVEPEPEPEAEIEVETEPELEPEVEIEVEPEPEPEPEPEAALPKVGETRGDMKVAPVKVITEAQAKWGRLILVGLVSALLGAVLALVILYGWNGTLDFRTATDRAIRAEAFRLEGDMDVLATELDQLSLRLDGMQDLAPVIEAAQADIQTLGRDLASVEANLELVTGDLAEAQSALVAMGDELGGLQDELAGLGQDLGALDQQVGAMEKRLDAMDEDIQGLVEAAGRFDAFLDGLRQLLGESEAGGSTKVTPMPTPTPAMEMTVIPLATPTPAQ